MDSCHPKHCKTAILYSQALFLQRIWKRVRDLKNCPLKSGYNEQCLNFEKQVALDTPMEAYLQLKWNQDKPAWTPLVVMYHPTLLSFRSTTSHHLPILHASERLRRAFPFPPLIAFWRPRNFRDYLILVALTSTCTLQELPGNCLCRVLRCKTHLIPLATNEFSSHKTGWHFKIKINASCKSSNVIYLNYVQEVWPAVHRWNRMTTPL